MFDKFLVRRKDVPASTKHNETEKEVIERFEKANFEIKKLQVDKEHVKRRMDKLCQGRSKLQDIRERTRAREEESKRKGQEAQMQRSANLASSYKCEIGKHEDEINRLEGKLVGLDRQQRKWDLELKKLRDIEKKEVGS